VAAVEAVAFVKLREPCRRLGRDKIRAQAGLAERAADDLLHFAFMQVNAGTKHESKLKRKVESGKRKLLLANKADLEVKDNNGETPLQEAALEGNDDLVKFLLDKKADVNTKNNKGNTPLLNVAHQGRISIVRLLLANKADVNSKNNDGNTPLQLAVLQGHNDVAELLRQYGSHE
jgi:ankyrin repeat protein